jgi:hypothetical protein
MWNVETRPPTRLAPVAGNGILTLTADAAADRCRCP